MLCVTLSLCQLHAARVQSADRTRGHIETHTQTRSTQDTDGQQRADNRTPGGRAAKHIQWEGGRKREKETKTEGMEETWSGTDSR